VALACGQKGPPLAPLHLVPAAPTDVSLRRVDDRVRIQFVLPSKNLNGPGPIELDHVDVFAMTIGAGASTPPNRELLSREHLVGQIAVRPAPVEGQEPAPGETRPEPGARVTFDEDLTPATLTPVVTAQPSRAPGPSGASPAAAASTAAAPAASGAPKDAPPGTPVPQAGAPVATAPGAPGAGAASEPATRAAAATSPAAPAAPGEAPQGPPVEGVPTAPSQSAAAKPPPAPVYPMRVYVIRGVTKSGRAGATSPRMNLPLTTLPPAPAEVAARFTEKAVIVEWKPAPEAPAGLAYNVYAAEDPLQPINPAPLAGSPFEYAGVKSGNEACFAVRSVSVTATVALESPLSREQCVTPQDIFPPAAPRGLAAVPTPGQISLIWDANAETDLAGYIVLRGEAGGELRPLTPSPIKETSYRDAAVTPGVRYAYAIVAVDVATPPNTSAQSARVEETAR
jgi:hypothetical protein